MNLLRNLICSLKSTEPHFVDTLLESIRSFDPKLQAVSKLTRKNLRFFQAKQVIQEVQ